MNYGCLLVSSSTPEIIAKDNSVASFSSPIFVSSTTHLIKELTPIGDQRQVNSCVGNGVADAFEMLLGLESESVQQLSRLFIYWNARHYAHAEGHDSGSVITLAMQGLKDFGVCLESTWSYDESKVLLQPNQIAYKEGDDNRLTDFYKIRSSGSSLLNDIETAIRKDHPVVFGTAVGSEFESYTGEDIVFDYPIKSLGNHCMIIVGVSYEGGKRKFYIRNSWGESWGISGHAWFSEEYLLHSAEFYVGTRMPELLV